MTAVASSATPRPAARPAPVRVNGVEITRAAIAREIQNHVAANPVEAWRQAARALVVRALLLQEIARLDIAATPAADSEGRRETEEEALIRALLEQEVTTPRADADTCARYFAQNRRRFRTPDLAAASHILFPAAPGDRAARAEAREQAGDVLAAIAAGTLDFAEAARRHSACPSGALGGSLGQIGPGQTVPEFERALDRLEPGELGAAPVETRYGFHLVRLDQRVAGRELPFEAVAAAIAAYLEETARRTALRQYVELLAGRAAISGIDMAGAASPLVQ